MNSNNSPIRRKKTTITAFSLALYFSAISPAHSQTLEDVTKAFEEGRNTEAIEIATSLAEEGNTEAIMSLSRAYYEGVGVNKDVETSVYWLEKAAELGHTSALYRLGRLYASGEILGQDADKALRLLNQSIQQGSIDALTYLGLSYISSDWLPENDEEAIELLTQAAEKGGSKARMALAEFYSHGIAVPQDYRQAFYWYKDVADEEFNLGVESYDAKLNIGKMYHKGQGTPQNHIEALHYLLSAAEASNSYFNPLNLNHEDLQVEAHMYLARMYFFGDGVSENKAEAAHWFRRAAELGDPQAMFLLANMYADGLGVEQDNTMAYALHSLAAYHGHEDAEEERDSVASSLSQHQLNRAQEFTSSWKKGNIIPSKIGK